MLNNTYTTTSHSYTFSHINYTVQHWPHIIYIHRVFTSFLLNRSDFNLNRPPSFWKLDAKSCILAYSEHKILYMKKTQFLPFFYEIHVLYVSLYQKTYISLQSLAQYTIQGQTLWGKNKNYKKVEWKRLINFFLPNKIWKQNDLRKDHVLMHQWNILKTSYITKNVSGKTWCVKSPYLISIWRGSLGCQVQMF